MKPLPELTERDKEALLLLAEVEQLDKVIIHARERRQALLKQVREEYGKVRDICVVSHIPDGAVRVVSLALLKQYVTERVLDRCRVWSSRKGCYTLNKRALARVKG